MNDFLGNSLSTRDRVAVVSKVGYMKHGAKLDEGIVCRVTPKGAMISIDGKDEVFKRSSCIVRI